MGFVRSPGLVIATPYFDDAYCRVTDANGPRIAESEMKLVTAKDQAESK